MKITDEMTELARKAADEINGGASAYFVILGAFEALSASPAGVVKPLEWHKSHMTGWNDDWHTTSPFIYTVRCADENGWKWSGHSGFGYASTPEAAKDAAFADYSARIMSAIEPAGVGVETRDPDFCYDPSWWEVTYDWADRFLMHDDGMAVGEVKKVATLYRGPQKWMVNVPISWTDDGDPDETEVQWFDSEEAARAALTKEATHD